MLASVEKVIEQLIDTLVPEKHKRLVKQRLNLTVPDNKETYPLPKRLVQPDGFIHVFTDGSCNYNQEKLGAGIVIATTDNKTRIKSAKAIIPEENFDLQRFGAMKAEFRAATDALNSLPDSTNVHLYTDHPLLRQALRRHIAGYNLVRPTRYQNEHSPEYLTMVGELEDALSRKGQIEVTNLKDNQSRRMAEAHKLAAIGSGAKGIKVRRAVKTPQPLEPLEMGDPRDSSEDTEIEEEIDYSNPMTVIDLNNGPKF